MIGDFDAEGRCIVDDQQNMLIVHPDHLISSTVVADSFTCVRRAVLQDRVKATSQTTKPIVYGQLIHQVFQEAMLQRRMDTESMTELIDLLLSQNLDALYKAGLGLNTAKAHILSKLPAIQAWARTFVGDRPKVNAAISDISGSSSSRRLAVRRLLEVEEHVWSPMYGLKGNIDATVEAVFEQDGSETTVLAPLELKTGHNKSTNHHAQTALYTLLLSDRYDVEVAAGILYYTDSSETKRIPAVRHELRHMVQQRNTLATYLKDRLALPPMKKDDFQCGRCYAKTACFVYHKATEQGDGESSGLPAAFNQLTAHLTLKDQTFFRHWDDLLTKEEKDTLKFRRELWTMTGSERESFGRCFSHVTIEHDASYEQEMSEKINKYQYTFTKPKCGPNFSFVESQISTGEPIVISDEEGHYALANGYIVHVYKHRVIVAVDRKLSNSRKRAKGFHPVYHQTFIGLDGQDGRRHEPASNLAPRPEEPIFYRIDRDEFSNGMATARNNLIQLMDDSVFGSRKVRKLIVEGVAPTYRKLPADAVETVLSQNCLNEDQTKAIQHVLSAKDHALVLGMPGTGKTTTIAQIIRALARLGKSVLLTSYTHSAVDNILLKLKDDKIPMLRLGAMAKIHPEVREFALLDATKKESIEKIRESYQKPKIVATTCLGVNHPVFLERVFDYCIVDEASQITLPVCIGPIRMARSFVLVGDHYQLTPLVKNDEAKAGGLDISLFKYLSDAHPESVVNLEHQYRMNKEITSLSSTLIYQGRLKPGNEKVALQRLQITNAEGLQALHISEASAESCGGSSDCWLRKVVDPENPVCFVATDRIVLAKEQMTNSRIVNPAECLLVAQAVEALIASGVADSSIGVISFYRSQISLLRYALGHRPGVELHTVDKFQGRDKEVVIVSWVRSNEKNEVGELLQDWRRINVAITRARSKLVLVGNTSTLATDDLLDRLIRMIRESACMISLSGGEQDAHRFEALQGTQILTKHNPVEKSSNSDLSWTDRTVTGTPQNRGAASMSIEGDAIIKEEAGSPDKPAILSKPPLKENIPPIRSLQGPKHARVGRRVLLKNRPVLRDILNDLDV